MMIRRWCVRIAASFVAAAIPAVLSTGCARPTSTLEITSYQDAGFPGTYVVEMTSSAYSVDPGGDYHIVGRTAHTPEDGDGAPIEQLLHVHLFWKPLPGKTFDDPTTVDATIRYAIVTAQGTAVYSGTGFVYPKKRRWSDDVVVSIEGARLGLDFKVGDPPELFDRARLAGTLVAEHDPGLTLDLRRQLDVRSGPRE